MSINKKILLGKIPLEAGMKDAVHVAIVSLRAGQCLKPGQRIKLNEDREAIAAEDGDSFGVADPWVDSIARGTLFLGMLNMDEVPNVRHVWDHPQHSFEAPEKPPEQNRSLLADSEKLGVTYDELMNACARMVKYEKATEYNGPLTEEEFEDAVSYCGSNVWYEWSDESGHEFSSTGTECCPEYDYPEFPFEFVVKR